MRAYGREEDVILMAGGRCAAGGRERRLRESDISVVWASYFTRTVTTGCTAADGGLSEWSSLPCCD